MWSGLTVWLRRFNLAVHLRRLSRKHDLTVVWPSARERYGSRQEAMADAACWLCQDWAWHGRPWELVSEELAFQAECYRAFRELYGRGSDAPPL